MKTAGAGAGDASGRISSGSILAKTICCAPESEACALPLESWEQPRNLQQSRQSLAAVNAFFAAAGALISRGHSTHALPPGNCHDATQV